MMTQIAVIGGGIDGAMTAALLSRFYAGSPLTIYWLGEDENPLAGSVVSLLPATRAFFRFLELEESELIAGQAGSFKLGNRWRDWCRKGQDFVHAFGDYGAGRDAMEFNQLYLRWGQMQSQRQGFDEFSLSAMAARQGRFRHPVADLESIFSSVDYGWQINLQHLFEILILRCEQSRVVRHKVNVSEIKEGGALICLHNGREIRCGAVFDTRRGMSAESLAAWVDLSPRYPLRWYQAEVDASAGNPLLTDVVLDESGFHRRSSLGQGSFVEGFLHEQAGKLSSSQELDLGFRQCLVRGACLAVGPAAAHLASPLFSTLDITWLCLRAWLQLSPPLPLPGIAQREYSLKVLAGINSMLDVDQLLFSLRQDIDQSHSKQELGGELAARIEFYRQRGKIHPYEGDVLEPRQWQSLLMGMECQPANCDIYTRDCELKIVVAHLQRISHAIDSALLQMPLYSEYIQNLSGREEVSVH